MKKNLRKADRENPIPVEYWFNDEFVGENNVGEKLDCITKCWTFKNKYKKTFKKYQEFEGWDWAEFRDIGVKFRDGYIFVYRIYHRNRGEYPKDYEKRFIHGLDEGGNPYVFKKK